LKKHGLFSEEAVAGRLQRLQVLQPLCNRCNRSATVSGKFRRLLIALAMSLVAVLCLTVINEFMVSC